MGDRKAPNPPPEGAVKPAPPLAPPRKRLGGRGYIHEISFDREPEEPEGASVYMGVAITSDLLTELEDDERQSKAVQKAIGQT